ncbi:hypothetical protein Pan216_28190 [Planctomycetes bacterium Pan216]|uniref:Uncharacterized protein n=1 Tax=Kolteria novifilia TaxID=2527975 RepID=A0A518B4P8_9BACT|nr:hypothetical protein Pan216_28190 [Planctomycetes bacterium Pan216]
MMNPSDLLSKPPAIGEVRQQLTSVREELQSLLNGMPSGDVRQLLEDVLSSIDTNGEPFLAECERLNEANAQEAATAKQQLQSYTEQLKAIQEKATAPKTPSAPSGPAPRDTELAPRLRDELLGYYLPKENAEESVIGVKSWAFESMVGTTFDFKARRDEPAAAPDCETTPPPSVPQVGAVGEAGWNTWLEQSRALEDQVKPPSDSKTEGSEKTDWRDYV